MAGVEDVLIGVASVFSLGTTQKRTAKLKERLVTTRKQLQMQRFWRDKHNARRFVDAKEEEIRAIGAASIYLAGFTSVALFQLSIPLSVSNYVVVGYAALGALTVAMFGYCVILYMYLLGTLYLRANALRRSVQRERDHVLEGMGVATGGVDDEVEGPGPGGLDKGREDEAEAEAHLDEYVGDGIGHREERELKKWWALGHGPYTDDTWEEHSSLGHDFLGMFATFKRGTACFVLLFMGLGVIKAYEHRAHMAFSLVCFLLPLGCVYAFLRGIHWNSVGLLEESYAAETRLYV